MPVSSRSTGRSHLALVLALVAVTVAVFLPITPTPAFRAPGTRVALETTRFLASMAAAGLLASGGTGVDQAARRPFVAALVLLGVTDLWFGVLPNLGTTDLTGDETLLPWIAARYVVGVLFVLAGAEWPRWSTARLVTVSLLALVAIEVVIVTGPSPALPTVIGPDGFPQPTPVQRAFEIVPMALFGLGAFLAERLYRRDEQPLERWLSWALIVGVFTQLHEAIFPSGLGPVITSADLLRAVTALVLLAGVVRQLARLRADRVRALDVSQADLRELREVSSRLQDYVEREASFRSVVTHELSTPVITISAYGHLLQRGGDPQDRQRAVDGIVTEARRLRTLIDRMDDLKEMEDTALSVDLRPVAIAPLLDEAASFGRALAGEHAVHVASEDRTLPLDPVRISQVLRNLITNAVRHAPVGTPIVLEGRARDGSYVIRVADQGPGVGVHAEELFEKYRRGQDDAEGTGLGLWVVRQIVNAHGGTVAFERPTDTGARVRVVLPLRESVEENR